MRVNLAVEALWAEDAWHRVQAPYVPLSVAAAVTFHQVQRSTKAIVTRDDYEDALNIASSTLSRLIPILTLRNPREGRVAITIEPAHQRFARGATELRHSDGTSIGNLWVKTSEFHSALSLIKRSGILGASFALAASDQRAREAGRAPARGVAAELILGGQRERRRISAVLHEQLAQVLAGSRMQLDAVREKLDVELRERLGGVVESLNLAYETALALALELAPPELATFGLVKTLGSLASEQAALHGLKVLVHARAEDEPQDVETRAFLFDAARLLLLNVVRHAQVREATVKLQATDGMLELAVSDCGAGFDPETVQWRCQPCSLRHLEQRAGALGGSLSVHSHAGGGTRVAVRIPKILTDVGLGGGTFRRATESIARHDE
jgi:signal transduction histidine kinase